MNACSTTHVVMIPSYNSGKLLLETIRHARSEWCPVWVVIDGSIDGSGAAAEAAAMADSGLRVLRLPTNCGKGAAIHHGVREASRSGFTHVLTMDADGQHPASAIPAFMAASQHSPEAMILGVPEFGDDAPIIRVRGRRISNWWVNLETLWDGIADSLFGFRVYPIGPLLRVMDRTRWMRRFDFDPEAVVRLSWAGVPAVNLPAPVRYLRPEEGGISHFHYLRDNLLLTAMHVRLMLEFLVRWPEIHARTRGKPSR